jgi:hypothetical protein
VVAVLGCLLVPAGAALVVIGVRGHHDGTTVVGILLASAGLICLRILWWARRIRLMTQAGLVLHVSSDDAADEHPSPPP